VNRDPNEYTVTQGGAVYSRPIGASDFDQPGARGSWRPAHPQIDPATFLNQVVEEQLVAGIDDRGNPVFPLTQGEFREFVERRMDERRIQDLLQNNPGSGLIDIMRQRGLLRGA
jgi:hypothetical protein